MIGLKIPAVEDPEDELDKLIGSLFMWSPIVSIIFVKEIKRLENFYHLSRFILHSVAKINDNHASL